MNKWMNEWMNDITLYWRVILRKYLIIIIIIIINEWMNKKMSALLAVHEPVRLRAH